MNTFTAQDMEDYADYVVKAKTVQVEPTLSHWYAQRNKPAKKVIDLSVLIESQIDCEFSDDFSSHITIGPLLLIGNYCEYPYITDRSSDRVHGKCRPRMNHIHAWQGGECPLPEGFMVMPHYRKPLKIRVNVMAADLQWGNWGVDHDIIAFEVLRVADGYVMPWEQDNE